MKYQLILACSAALLATGALAGDDKSSAGKDDAFASLDQDSDGRLTKEEVSGDAGLSASFDKLDSNSDGHVSKSEFRRNTMPKQDSSTRPY